MRTLTAAMSNLLSLNQRSHHIKVEIDRDGAGTWIDLTSLYGYDWVVGAVITQSIDAPVASAVVHLRHRIFGLSLNPLMVTSPPNVGGVLCQPYRKVRISTATIPYGTTPTSSDYTLVFRGRLWKATWTHETIECECRDEGGDLQDLWIETPKEYGSDAGVAIETLSQSILDDNSTGVTLWSADGTGGDPFDSVTNPTTWLISTYHQDEMSILQALQRMWVEQLGWDLRYKYQPSAADFKLVATNPTRTSPTVNQTFSADTYRVEDCSLANADVRNAVRVAYRAKGGLVSTVTTVTDSGSITKYGRKFMQVAEEPTSQIDTSTEATALANTLLSDLKEPTLMLTISVPYYYAAELNDYYTISQNGVHFSTDQSLAVSAIVDEFGPGPARTRLTLMGAPKAAYGTRSAMAIKDSRKRVTSDRLTPIENLIGVLQHNTSLGSYSHR